MHRISLINESYRQSLAAKPQQGNSVLDVATVNFEDYQGQVLGVILTPCFLGLLLLPVELEGWRDHQVGDAHTEKLPAGEFEFIHGWDPKFGAFGCCTLFTTMDEFADQAAALRMAERAMQQLFVETPPANPVADGAGVADESSARVAEACPQAKDPSLDCSVVVADEAIDMKRRGLFTGALFGRK